MIIAHVLSSFGVGGQEGMALDLAARQKRAGHSVFAISLAAGVEGPRGVDFRRAGVRTLTVPRRDGFDPTLVPRLYRAFWRVSPQVVHTHNPQALVYGAPAGFLAGAAVVHTKHGRNPDPARRRMLRRAAAVFTSAYVAVSPTTARVAREQGDCDPGKLRVIENGVDVFRFAPDPHSRRVVREELGIPETAWVVGTVGRLALEKNYPLLVRAAAPLLAGDRFLVFVGDGPERTALERQIRESGVTRNTLLLGMRSDADRLLRAFDVFALSSDTEGLPLVVPEAMSSGVPVVSTSVGGIPDVVDRSTGLLVPPGDEAGLRRALRALCEDRARSESMGRAARAAALSRYSSERMLSEYMELYERVISGRGRPWILSPSSPS